MTTRNSRAPSPRIEWPTLALIAGCYVIWGLATTVLTEVSLTVGVLIMALMIGLFSSLQHEVIHGHPFKARWLNEVLVFPSLPLWIPFQRFRDTHLDHHQTPELTDPYDDPESNYMDPEVWGRLAGWQRAVLSANNTLAGRIVLGAAISQIAFMRDDARRIKAGEPGVLAAWVWHIPAVGVVLAWLVMMPGMPIWAYLIASYLGLSLVKIRTFLEHQAATRASGRSAIVEDRGALAFLFLNNNLHAVHHAHPQVPWYRLQRLYWDNRDRFLRRNGGYAFSSYGSVLRQFLFRRKDPVPHPDWHKG